MKELVHIEEITLNRILRYGILFGSLAREGGVVQRIACGTST